MMNDTIERLKAKLWKSPILRSESSPSVEEIDNASQEIGVPFTADYREFLLMFGGAMVGPYPIFGLRPVEVMGREWSVLEVTRRYRNDRVPGCDNWVVFSEDHAGNPVGFDTNGIVWTYDHDFGGITQLSDSFEQYIRERCLKIE